MLAPLHSYCQGVDIFSREYVEIGSFYWEKLKFRGDWKFGEILGNLEEEGEQLQRRWIKAEKGERWTENLGSAASAFSSPAST